MNINSPRNMINTTKCPSAPKKSWKRRFQKNIADAIEKKQKEEEKPSCPICMDNLLGNGSVTTKCGHDICISCYTTLVRSKRKMPSCPMCRQDMAESVRDIPLPEPEEHPDTWMNEWNRCIAGRRLGQNRPYEPSAPNRNSRL